MGKENDIKWLNEPEEQDYPAAESYLTLLWPEADAAEWVKKLRKAKVVKFKAKDIFRASQLSLLGVSNSHVKTDWKKIENGEALSPLLLVRDTPNGKLMIADGYHRLCAVYSFNEDIWIPAKIV
jgi:disulfide oxidoreductase YuzD